MVTRLLKTTLAYQNSKEFLDSRSDVDWEIKSYLTQHILILLSAEIQQEVYKIADERCQLVNDVSIKNFMSSTTKQLIRSVAKEDLAKFVNHFGADKKEAFNNLLDHRAVTVYGSALAKRHEIAHKGTCSATFGELAETIKCADNVLNALITAVHDNQALAVG